MNEALRCYSRGQQYSARAPQKAEEDRDQTKNARHLAAIVIDAQECLMDMSDKSQVMQHVVNSPCGKQSKGKKQRRDMTQKRACHILLLRAVVDNYTTTARSSSIFVSYRDSGWM